MITGGGAYQEVWHRTVFSCQLEGKGGHLVDVWSLVLVWLEHVSWEGEQTEHMVVLLRSRVNLLGLATWWSCCSTKELQRSRSSAFKEARAIAMVGRA